jgi:hypothetical protein
MKAMPYMKLNPHLPQIIETLREDGQKAHPRDIRTAVNELESMARRIDALEELTERLTAERDEARRECRLLLLGREVLHGVRDLPAPPDDLVTIVPVPQKEDGK